MLPKLIFGLSSLLWFFCNSVLITHADGSRRVGFSWRLSVCLSVCFSAWSQKPLQLGSPNLTWKCSTMSLGNLFILRSKVKVTRDKTTVLAWVFTLLWVPASSNLLTVRTGSGYSNIFHFLSLCCQFYPCPVVWTLWCQYTVLLALPYVACFLGVNTPNERHASLRWSIPPPTLNLYSVRSVNYSVILLNNVTLVQWSLMEVSDI